jgi:hypothetical protein
MTDVKEMRYKKIYNVILDVVSFIITFRFHF